MSKKRRAKGGGAGDTIESLLERLKDMLADSGYEVAGLEEFSGKVNESKLKNIVQQIEKLQPNSGLTLKKAAAAAAEPAAGIIGKAKDVVKEGVLDPLLGKKGALLGKVGRGAGVAAMVAMLADAGVGYGMEIMKGRKRTRELEEAMARDPIAFQEGLTQSMMEDMLAQKVSAARLRLVRENLAGMDPNLYDTMGAVAAGDTITRLGPGEHRIGGSALLGKDTLDNAIAFSDIWD